MDQSKASSTSIHGKGKLLIKTTPTHRSFFSSDVLVKSFFLKRNQILKTVGRDILYELVAVI